MLGIGLALIFAPVASFFMLIISTGHAVQPGLDRAFFGLVYFGLYAGVLTVPLGVVFIVAACFMWRDK